MRERLLSGTRKRGTTSCGSPTLKRINLLYFNWIECLEAAILRLVNQMRDQFYPVLNFQISIQVGTYLGDRALLGKLEQR